jgi:hypothetical protein
MQNTLTKISYLSFLEALFHSTKMKQHSYSLLSPSFISLLVTHHPLSKS